MCKLKHAQTCHYYDQVAWLPLNRAIKSVRELHSHTMYIKLVQYVRFMNADSALHSMAYFLPRVLWCNDDKYVAYAHIFKKN